MYHNLNPPQPAPRNLDRPGIFNRSDDVENAPMNYMNVGPFAEPQTRNRKDTDLTNLLISLFGVIAPEVITEQMSSCLPGGNYVRLALDLTTPVNNNVAFDEVTYNDWQNRAGLEGSRRFEEGKCGICLEEKKEEWVWNACGRCPFRSCEPCLREWRRAQAHAQIGEVNDPQQNPPGEFNCPACRLPFDEEIFDDKFTRYFFGNRVRKGEYNIRALKDGEELVANPWRLFQTRCPRQRIELENGVVIYRLLATVSDSVIPVVVRCMRQDDVILEDFGDLYLVESGKGAYWPRTWSDLNLIRRVGISVIRNLFSTTDFNEEYVTSLICTMITREIPLWEDAEQEVRSWTRSGEAIDIYESVVMTMVRKKDVTQRLKWVKEQMNGDLTGNRIEWFYHFFYHLKYVRLLFIIVACVFFPTLIKLVVDGPDHVWRWILLSLFTAFMYRSACFLGFITNLTLPKLKVMNSLFVWKTCSKNIAIPDIMSNCKCSMSRRWDKDCDEGKIGVYGCVIHGLPYVVPQGCGHDMYNGLRIRYLFKREWVKTTCDEFLSFGKIFLKEIEWSHWSWYSPTEWLNHLKPSRRKTLVLEDNGKAEDQSNWSANIFVKAEAYVGKTWDNFKPRIIQCRASGLQMAIGPFFYSLYKFVARTFSKGKYLYSVNFNALELGEIAYLMFSDGVVVMSDVSNFDGSVSKVMLQLEVWFLLSIVPYLPPFMNNLITLWFKTTGSSKGVKYSCDWGRRSGDMWTSTFNTLLHIVIAAFVWGILLIKGVVNGDDGFYQLKKYDVTKLKKYEELGLNIKIDVVETIHDLEFCSGKFYQTERGWKWGLKPWRQLVKFGINFGRHSPKKFKSLLYGNALSMLPVGGHIPIFGVFLRSLVRSAFEQGITAFDEHRAEWQIDDSIIDEIHPSEIQVFKNRYKLTDLEYDKLLYWAENASLDDFPCVLEDELFLRCAQIDAGVAHKDNAHRSHPSWYGGDEKQSLYQSTEWFSIVEELICFMLPYSWIIFGLFETLCGSVFALPAHYVLSTFRVWYGFWPTLLVHLIVNFCLGGNLNTLRLFRSRRPRYDPFDVPIQCVYGTMSLRVPDLFRSIHERVGTITIEAAWKYRHLLTFREVVRKIQNKFSRQTNKNQNQNTRRNKNNNKKPKNKNSSKNNNRKNHMPKQMLQLARMIADPCTSTPTDGLYGDKGGFVTKTKVMYSPGSANTSGFILWCPSCFGQTAPATPISTIIYSPAGGAQILNTVADPLGTNLATSGLAITSAGDSFGLSTTVSKLRTAAACMRMTYIGTTSTCAGRVAFVEGLTTSQLMTGLPAIDDLFALATKVERTTLEPMEVTYRPDDTLDSRFKEAPFTPILKGTAAAVASTITTEGKDLDPKWIGFAWAGIAATSFTIETIRIVEWVPDTGSSFAMPVPVQESDSYVRPILSYLDRAFSGWSTTAMQHGGRIAADLANMALAGGGPPLMKQVGAQALRIAW